MRQKLSINHKALQELSEAMSRANDPELIRHFFDCLLTPNELAEVSTRWALTRLIDDGMSQRKIAEELGLSLCKITRGSRELKKEDSAFQQFINIYKNNR